MMHDRESCCKLFWMVVLVFQFITIQIGRSGCAFGFTHQPIYKAQQRYYGTSKQTTSPKFLLNPHSISEFSRSSLPAAQSPLSEGYNKDNNNDDATSKKPLKDNYNWTRQHLSIALPALVGMLADPLLSLMDTAYVGRVGATELAALGACTSIFHLAFNAFRATTSATTSLVGSAKTKEDAKEVAQISLQLGITLGLLLLTTLAKTSPWCLATMGIPNTSPLYKPAYSYLTTRLWAAPAVLFILVSEGTFRGYGDTRIPLAASIVASLINLILDPILMFPLGWGVRGAAAATAMSQIGAAAVYFYFLNKRQMLPSRSATSHVDRGKVILTILKANLAMICKQGSLLLGWAFATRQATKIGAAHVAAHQVALSCWLVFALILDGAGVSAQVLMSQSLGLKKRVRSLISYMFRMATLQGFATTALILAASPFLPRAFTSDVTVRGHLTALMPHLAWQQLLVSLTLVTESLAVGGKKFGLLAGGTIVASLWSMWELKKATDVVTIWSRGIVTLFCGRLITGIIGTILVGLTGGEKTSSADEEIELN